VTRSTWIGDYNDPNTFLDLFRSDNGNNRTGWKNARYDALMDEGQQQVDLHPSAPRCCARRKRFWCAMKRRSFRFIFTSGSIITIRRGSRAFIPICWTIIRSTHLENRADRLS
jgi:hypothetical protein